MSLSNIKESLLLNGKNLLGWKTPRKLIVFCVDDYGNVRLDSREARRELDRAGLKVRSRFDACDALETREDLEVLFETLSSVADRNGRPAVFTPYALSCNIDFERVAESKYRQYYGERLPETFRKLADRHPTAYAGTWDLWREGIEQGLLRPQFHGREHLNLHVFKKKLTSRDPQMLTALRNRSYTSLSSKGARAVSYTAAYAFWEMRENEAFKANISAGLDDFAAVYGYRATCFTPPAFQAHPVLYPTLAAGGIQYLEGPFLGREHQGEGKYRRKIGYTGKTNDHGQVQLVRNVVFEPTDGRGIDWPAYALRQIEVAFRWNRPAIISSHRVNFCGHIDESNRTEGIGALQTLLKEIVARWPDCEFLAADELGNLIPRITPRSS